MSAPLDAGGLPFAPDAGQFVAAAASEAALRGHEYLGTEHLAFALVLPAHPGSAAMLGRLGVDLASVRSDLEATVLRGSAVLAPEAPRPYTSRLKQVFGLAEQYARDLKRPAIGVEHLVLGMLQEGVNIGAQVLGHHGLTLDAVRAHLESSGGDAEPGTPGSSGLANG